MEWIANMEKKENKMSRRMWSREKIMKRRRRKRRRGRIGMRRQRGNYLDK